VRESTNSRTHCDCGHELEPVESVGANWGDWKCRKCYFRAYCQDCGSPIDGNEECSAYREAQDEDSADNSAANC
jgi:hypothetical protein